MGIAIQGERGAFSEEAARLFFGPETTIDPCETFADAFARVVSGQSQGAMMPCENSLAGTINDTIDLLLEHRLSVIGEVFLPVDQCLMALPGTKISELHTVMSHPQALAQSSRFLKQLGVKSRVGHDTAGSARLVAEEWLQGVGAIAAARAAEIYGLDLLATAIQNEPTNVTRFFAIYPGREPADGARKTSLVIRLAHEPGSLYRVLGAFAERQLNLTKLESRPTRQAPWEYVFYLDVDGDLAEPTMQAAMAEVRDRTAEVYVIGCYPAAHLPERR